MYKILLCVRYLRTRYIALASIISVMLGVATMIVVNSVMAGFSTEMRDRIHGILADVVVESINLDGFDDAEKHLALIRQAAGEYVDGMTATVEVYGMLSFEYAGQWITRPITLIGIKPEGKSQVGPFKDYLVSYNDATERDPKSNEQIVVRPALRSRDVPPGWDLTPDAIEYRRKCVEQQQWYQKHFPEEEPGQDEPGLLAPPGAEPKEATDIKPLIGPPNLAGEPAKTSDLPEDPFADQEGQGPEMADGNAVPDFSSGDEPPDDPAAPLEGRVIIGVGLISFPYEDKKTGAVKTMMMVRPGDDVKISTVSAGIPPEPRRFNATIVDGFKSGMSEYDSNLVFCNLEYLQTVRGMVHPTTGVRSITSIQIKLKDFADSDEVVKRLKAAFPLDKYSIHTWEQKQGPLLAAVDIESAILNVLLFLIIAVAGFGILAIFFMIVVEKTRDIGILKALGASSQGVMSIFLSYGLALGIVGSGVGVVLGLLFVRYINVIELWITWLIGRKVFDERIYYFPEIPTDVNPMMVIWVAVGAMVIAVLASVLPARRAARLHPVEALRYE